MVTSLMTLLATALLLGGWTPGSAGIPWALFGYATSIWIAVDVTTESYIEELVREHMRLQRG